MKSIHLAGIGGIFFCLLVGSLAIYSVESFEPNTRKLPENALISTVCDSPRIYRVDYEGSSYLITNSGTIINHPRKEE